MNFGYRVTTPTNYDRLYVMNLYLKIALSPLKVEVYKITNFHQHLQVQRMNWVLFCRKVEAIILTDQVFQKS